MRPNAALTLTAAFIGGVALSAIAATYVHRALVLEKHAERIALPAQSSADTAATLAPFRLPNDTPRSNTPILRPDDRGCLAPSPLNTPSDDERWPPFPLEEGTDR